MTIPPCRVNGLVESITLTIVVEGILILMDTIINTKIKSASNVDWYVMVAVKPFNWSAIDAVQFIEDGATR